MNVKLTYFKASGKYYTSSDFPLMDGENIYDAAKRIREMLKFGDKMPGLSGNWSEEGAVLLEVNGLPHLITL